MLRSASHRCAGRAIAGLGLLASCTTACGPASDLQSGLTTCAADFGTALAACQRVVRATVGCKSAAQRVVRALGTCRKAAQRVVRAKVGCKSAAQRVVQAQITCRQPAQRLVQSLCRCLRACVRCQATPSRLRSLHNALCGGFARRSAGREALCSARAGACRKGRKPWAVFSLWNPLSLGRAE